MKAFSLMLVVSLIVPAVPVAARQAAPGRGVASMFSDEAIRRALRASAPGGVSQTASRSAWSDVRGLAAGAAITLTVEGAAPADRRFVLADNASVVVLKLPDPAIAPADGRRLVEVAAAHPERLAAALMGPELFADDVRIGPNGVYVGSRRLADRDRLLERVARGNVVEITAFGKKRGSVAGAVFGGAGGFALGLLSAISLAYKQCGGSCADERLFIGLSLVGMPIAGGMGGYYGFARRSPDFTYRRP